VTERDGVVARLNESLSPGALRLGGRVTGGSAAERWVEMTFTMRSEFCHNMGLQGGYIAAMLDNAMERAVFLVSHETPSPPTLELKVSYLAPGGAGAYRARGQVEHIGQSFAFLSASVWDDAQRLIAKASATAKLVSHRDLGVGVGPSL
jgi:acyl-CoA thioesterase